MFFWYVLAFAEETQVKDSESDEIVPRLPMFIPPDSYQVAFEFV